MLDDHSGSHECLWGVYLRRGKNLHQEQEQLYRITDSQCWQKLGALLVNKNTLQAPYVILHFLVTKFFKHEINCNNIFYLTQYLQDTISMSNSYKIIHEIFYSFFILRLQNLMSISHSTDISIWLLNFQWLK